MVALVTLSDLYRFQNRLRRLEMEDIFFTIRRLPLRRSVSSLSLIYRYFYGNSSDKPRYLDPPVQIFIDRTRRVTSTASSHPHLLHVSSLLRGFRLAFFFPKSSNISKRGCFLEIFNLDLLIVQSLSIFILKTFYFFHSIRDPIRLLNFHCNPLPWVTFEPCFSWNLERKNFRFSMHAFTVYIWIFMGKSYKPNKESDSGINGNTRKKREMILVRGSTMAGMPLLRMWIKQNSWYSH